jgi:hypothetical protein
MPTLDELLQQTSFEQTAPIKSLDDLLTETESPSTFNQPAQPEDPASVELFNQLGGKLPSTKFPPQFLESATGFNVPSPKFRREVDRRKAFNEIIRQGGSPEQIKLVLETQDKIKGIPIGRTAGGIGGALAATAIAGRFIPGPIDDAAILAGLIAAGGAGAGGVAGKAAQVGLEEKRLISSREALSAFATEAAFEGGGRAAVLGAKALFSPIIRKIVPEAAALVDDFAKVGGTFSPTELDDRWTLRAAESISRGGIGSGELFTRFEKEQGTAAVEFARGIVDSISEGVARQSPQEIGDIFAQGISRPGGRVLNLFDELIDPLYKRIDDIGGGATVSTKTLKAFARKHLSTDTRLNGQFLSPAGKAKLNGIIGLEENLSFSDIRTLRSSFLKDARKLARDVDQSQGIIKQLAGITDDAIFDPSAAKGLSQEALTLWENTRNLYKAGQEGIKTTFSESLAKRLLKNPSGVAKEVFPSNNPKAIRQLRESLITPIAGKRNAEGQAIWNQLRQTWLADAVEKATKEGVVKPAVYDNLLRKLTPAGLKEMFPEKEVAARVGKIQSLFRQAGKKPPQSRGLVAVGAQALGLQKMYQGAKEGDYVGFTAGAALAMGPLAFAKMATDPRGIKLLTTGLKLKPGASGLVPIAARMVKILKDIDSDEQKRLKKAQQPTRERKPRQTKLSVIGRL